MMKSSDYFVEYIPMNQDMEAESVKLFAGLGVPGGLPKWPDEQRQRQYTAGSGLNLMRNTVRFVHVLAKAEAFDQADWKGLDYGCGWGRIASVMLSRGAPEQLDLCDAWPSTMDILRDAGFANRTFEVSELLKEGKSRDRATISPMPTRSSPTCVGTCSTTTSGCSCRRSSRVGCFS